MEHQYVLETKLVTFKDIKMYFKDENGIWSDTSDINEATKFTLDDAIEKARYLKKNYGAHYKCVICSEVF